MTYVSTAERVGMRKGEVIGETKILVSLLNTKFQAVPQKYLDQIKNAHTDMLMTWAKRFVVTVHVV